VSNRDWAVVAAVLLLLAAGVWAIVLAVVYLLAR